MENKSGSGEQSAKKHQISGAHQLQTRTKLLLGKLLSLCT